MEIVVYYPETAEKQAAFEEMVARIHTEYVCRYIERLQCPIAQKLALVDAIAEAVLPK